MNIAVTGGSGFIGSRLVKRLAASGHLVRSTDIREPNFSAENVRFSTADLTQYADAERAVEGADAVYHIAGVVLEAVRKDPFKGSQLNVEMTRNVAEACRKKNVAKMVFASSFYVYDGIAEKHIVNEETPLAILNMELFGATKSFGESLLREYSRRFGLHYVILRYGSAYGFGECTNVILTFIEDGLAGRPLEVWGPGKRSNQYTYVDDLVEGSVLALERSDEVYNLISPWDTSVGELANMLAKLYGFKTNFRLDKKEGVSMPYMSSRKAEKDLGWRPTPILDGIRKMAAEINATHDKPVLVERKNSV
jgi:UDP-glucose 4-epimerase